MPTVETNGIETYYEEYGDGPPIVFLHGAISDHSLWAEQMQPLAETYRIIVYDLRGHGQTDRPSLEACSIEHCVDDLAALIDALDLDQPVVCGLSLGGMITYKFASEYPEKVSGLVTLGARSPKYLTFSEKLSHHYLTKFLFVLSRFERVAGVVESAFSWVYTKLHGEESQADQEQLAAIRDGHDCDFEPYAGDDVDRIERIVDSYMTTRVDFRAILVPTLILGGEHEAYIERQGEYICRRIPDADYAEIPEASHNSHVDNPEFITQAIREFMVDRVATQSGPAEV